MISSSIASFKLGEYSKGKTLRKSAEIFSIKYNEPLYPKVINLFIREENFHSKYLASFMRREGIPIRSKNFLDKIFRSIRKSRAIEAEIITLVTAEIIALTYYKVLWQATSSDMLKKICNQMLNYEIPHVVFQSYTILHFRQTKLLNIRRRLLMEVTTLTVYIAFYKFFKKNACKFNSFRKENIVYLKQSKEIVKHICIK